MMMTASNIAMIVSVLLAVETGNRPDADLLVGDGGAAVGALQEHKIHIDDCNRIMGRVVWTYSSRTNRTAAVDRAMIWYTHYAPIWRESDPVRLAVRWKWPDGRRDKAYERRIREANNSITGGAAVP